MRISRLPPLTSLRVFDAVARYASFKIAAEKIGVTATAVSHQIRILEESFGQRLFIRSARGVSLTRAGKVLYRASDNIFATLRGAVDEIAALDDAQTLTLSTTSNFLTNWLVPRLSLLQCQCPNLSLRLHSSTEIVDVSGPLADCAIRYSMQADASLASTLLYQDRFVLVASPQINLTRVANLMEMTLIHIDNRHVPTPEPDWAHWKARFGPPMLKIDKGINFSDETHAIHAAIAGQGVLLASELLVQPALEQGLLHIALPDALPGAGYYFVTSHEKASREDIVQIKRWLLEQF